MTSCRTEMETVSVSQWRELHHSIVVAAISVLVSGLTVDILNTFRGGFMIQCVKKLLMLSTFLHFRFLLCDFVLLKCNLSETFIRYCGYYRTQLKCKT